MDKTYNHEEYESKIYKLWEKNNSFTTKKGKSPYTILMPPPNANASLHAGHAMYTIDDILIRFKRMQGYSAQWIPGTDHAGFETQFVYEKHLAKNGQSRLDFDRLTLYQNIKKFVEDNSGLIFKQFKRLGFSADWDKSVFTLDKNVVDTVHQTFQKMYDDKLIYRDNYIVNFCTHCGTSLAELEVKHIDRIDPLYYIKYKLASSDEFISVATVRPETISVDTHLAINPKDLKNKHLIGQKTFNPLTNQIMEIIADEFVDPKFGTGIVKLTPAHDPNDYLVGQKHHLPIISIIDLNGRLNQSAGKYARLKIKAAREQVVKDLTQKDLMAKINNKYEHSVMTCYKCDRDLEPLTIPNWFIKVKDLKKEIIKVVKNDQVKFFPKKYKKHMLAWLNIMHDWPISRQIVWGIRIPVWYKTNQPLSVVFLDQNQKIISGSLSEVLKTYKLSQIEKGLQKISAPINAKCVISDQKPKGNYLPETDTFDTWFSSGQWPLVTNSPYPSDVMATLSDILKFWVSRMIMFGLYLKKEIPFKNVYLWSMVADKHGVKMSKSKGNVVNPIDLVDKCGADALRFSLIYGNAAGSKVILSEDKVRGMRNFANKLWNIARFLSLTKSPESQNKKPTDLHPDDQKILTKLNDQIINTTQAFETYHFNRAAETLYQFTWHDFADKYLEKSKTRIQSADPSALFTLNHSLEAIIKLLHPFMPFVTESIYQEVFAKNKTDLLITSSWPEILSLRKL